MNRNTRTLVLMIGGLALLAAISFPLWRPLLVDDTVNDPFPGLSAEEQGAFRDMPAMQQAELRAMATLNPDMADDMVRAMTGPDVPADEEMMDNSGEVVTLSVGNFVNGQGFYQTSGTATIYRLEDGSHVLRFENFRTTNGPDLHVYLSSTAGPRHSGELGDYVDLGELRGNVGNQNYSIPASVDLSNIRSIVIYCVPFARVFGTATLSEAS